MNKREFMKRAVSGSLVLALDKFPMAKEGFSQPAFSFNTGVDPLHIREASHYSETAKGVKCKLCPSECTPKPYQEGNCHTRFEKDGKMFTSGYGNPAIVSVDPPEKHHLFHFFPGEKLFTVGVAGCNLVCLNCNTWNLSQVSPEKTENQKILPEEIILKAKEQGCSTIAFSHTEPVVCFEYLLDTLKMAKGNNLKTVISSCGYIQEKPLRELAPFLDAAVIDIKSFDQAIYEKLNAGKLQPVLDGLKVFLELKVWLEISFLVIPTWNDYEGKMAEFCTWLSQGGFKDCPLHFTRFLPDHKLKNIQTTSAGTLEEFRKMALEKGMSYVYVDNLPGTGSVNTFCPKCNKMLIERKGIKILTNSLSAGACPGCKNKISGMWNN